MRQLAHLADIERQLLAPLQALLGDAQAVLGTELDSVRLEEAGSATSLDLPVATPSAALATAPEAQRAVGTPFAEALRLVPQGRVASPRALALRTEQAAFMGGASAPGMRVPSASAAGDTSAPTRPADRRVDTSLAEAEAGVSPAPRAGFSPMAPGNNRAPQHPMAPNSPSTTSAPPPLTASSTGTDFATLRATAHSGPTSRTAGSASLRRSQADVGQTEHLSIPAAETLSRSGPAPGAPLPGPALAEFSSDSPQTRHADASAAATAQPRAASPLTGANPPHRLLGIPLRPRQVLPSDTSFVTPDPSHALPPGRDSQAAARRFAAAVEPSLEHAYRLSQARLDTANRATTEAESPSLVRNTFNVTVALAADDANATLDPTKLEDALTDVLRAAARRHGLEI